MGTFFLFRICINNNRYLIFEYLFAIYYIGGVINLLFGGRGFPSVYISPTIFSTKTLGLGK